MVFELNVEFFYFWYEAEMSERFIAYKKRTSIRSYTLCVTKEK